MISHHAAKCRKNDENNQQITNFRHLCSHFVLQYAVILGENLWNNYFITYHCLFTKGIIMRGLNKTFIFGRLGNQPEIGTTSNGHVFTILSIATKKNIKRR